VTDDICGFPVLANNCWDTSNYNGKKTTFLTTSYYSVFYNPTAETLNHAVINKPCNFNHYYSLLQSRKII
jgi:hypothetical protein